MPALRRHDVVHELVPGPNILGTSSFHCNVVLDGANIGDRHALVELSPTTSEAVVSGMGVAADVFVNGQRIGSPTKVVHGDTLAFGTPHDAFTFDITVTSSVAASTASMGAPTFSKSTQGNHFHSRVHPSFRNQTLMDAALRSLVERKLLERKRLAAAREHEVKLPRTPHSVAQRHPLPRNDVEDEDDELPETLEKPAAAPRAAVVSSYIANKPEDIAACDDEDDLPEMVDRATSPGEMAPPPRATRTPSQQAAIDQRVLTYRRRILAIGLRAWRDALRRRKRVQEAAKRQYAAKRLQACFRRYRCRRLLTDALELRRRQRFWKPSILRLGSLWRKPRLRAALRAWAAHVHRALLDARQQSIARQHKKQLLLVRAWRSWTQHTIHSFQRRQWLLRCLRLCTLAAARRAVQTWRQHQLLQTTAQMEQKLLDEQARVKSLVHAISVQTQAEANAWAEQAKETNDLLRKDSEAQGELQALRAALTKDVHAVGSQTENAEVVVSEREVHAKMVAHLEAQLAHAETKINELKRAAANSAQTHRLASERFASSVDGFLERVLHDYDSRLMRCCAEVDVLQSLQDTHVAQFRTASTLVGYMQEERLAQYEMLSSLYDHVLATKKDYVITPALCLLDMSPNGQYLQTMLLQRFQRLRQLHEHMADQAGDDEKKLKYAKLLVAAMHARQVEFVETCIGLYGNIATS
ncbi:hypothetical protein SDRG_00505 [Saprolegnia diclina VS20]|uniref:FHA domain-containing protein n=1 Tax=Saprolegnia diclina (strain VS20) TaxID=1156394 RepID=T0QX18_SAPDV|nr:hypothetical protein SDRG_00505 [Saprolegnia diclina VS20]EQC42784.1 hypothetical protein SDRG_00505 [Saprolegnia diclina VS20]|eukprot:XP_008604207.1 hypothetical protein SDRG_00505 [Saprolegnia diclina VS20]